MSSDKKMTVEISGEEMTIDKARRTELAYLTQEVQKICDGDPLELLKYIEKMSYAFDNVNVEMDFTGKVSDKEGEPTVGPDMRVEKLLEEK